MRSAVVVIALAAGCQFNPGSPAAGAPEDARARGDAAHRDGAGPSDGRPIDAAAQPITAVQTIAAPFLGDFRSRTLKITATEGNLLVAATYSSDNGQAIALADSAGQSWTALAPFGDSPGCWPEVQLWWTPVTTAAQTTVSLTQPDDAALGMYVTEYAGAATVDPIDVAGGLVATTATAVAAAGALTTTKADLIVAVFGDLDGTGTMAVGSDFTVRGTDDQFYALVVDNAPGVAPGTYSPAASLPSANGDDACWAGAAAALRAQ